MTKESLEHLSSLMDGELSRDTGLFMTRRLSSDEELTAAWRRFHLIRDCIRQPGGSAAVVDLSDRMRGALAGEVVESAPTAAARWLKPVAGLAIAASVALMAITAIGPRPEISGPAGPDTRNADSFTSPNALPAVPLSQPVSYTPAQRERERRLNSYLLRHNQLAGSAGQQGFVSFVPIMTSRMSETADDETGVNQADSAASTNEPETNARQ